MSSTANVTRALNTARKALAKHNSDIGAKIRELGALRNTLGSVIGDAWNCGRGGEWDAMDAAVKAEILRLEELRGIVADARRPVRHDATARAFLSELGIG